MSNELNLTDEQKELLGIKDERVDFYFKVENSVIDGYTTEQLNEETGEVETVEKSYFDNIYELVVYTALSRYCNNGKVAFPSISTLARNCCCGITSIKKAVKGLEDKGFLKKINRKKSGTLENDTNIYAIKNIEEIKKVGRVATDVGRVATDVGRVATSKKNKLNKNNIKRTCKEELVPFENFFKENMGINFTATNQKAVLSLLKKLKTEEAVKSFLYDNYKMAVANKEKDPSVKTVEGLFCHYLKKEERIPEFVEKESKKEDKATTTTTTTETKKEITVEKPVVKETEAKEETKEIVITKELEDMAIEILVNDMGLTINHINDTKKKSSFRYNAMLKQALREKNILKEVG